MRWIKQQTTLLSLFTFAFVLLNCQSEFAKTMRKELQSGKKPTDLIFDFKIGQTQKEFYTQCWKLNKKKLVSQGPKNKTVRYLMKSNSKESDIQLLFYGIFNDNKTMTGMKMTFSHTSWSPWNKLLQSNKLIDKIKDTLLHWMGGNGFIKIKEADNDIFAKVDGNRLTTIFIKNSREVGARIEIVPKKLTR